jgi:hypothetical protein
MLNAGSEYAGRVNTSKASRRDSESLAPLSSSAAKEARSHLRSSPAQAYCAIDLGAESGRVVLVRVQNGVLETREIRRFVNEPVRYGSSLHWDVARLWLEICTALRDLEETNLQGIGVDAWGVDYALLGELGELPQIPYDYRDSRTNGVMEELLEDVPREEIYRATGIQFMPIDTRYQLLAANQTASRKVNALWQEKMAEFFVGPDNLPPDRQMRPLEEVFHL